mmetsp:Transcript_32590/g.98502  ORF Transcript_32590/g.98502 Transcript_32590/m.98502 type:complete len:338 (+) Transcript_32590:119-1132(+)
MRGRGRGCERAAAEDARQYVQHVVGPERGVVAQQERGAAQREEPASWALPQLRHGAARVEQHAAIELGQVWGRGVQRRHVAVEAQHHARVCGVEGGMEQLRRARLDARRRACERASRGAVAAVPKRLDDATFRAAIVAGSIAVVALLVAGNDNPVAAHGGASVSRDRQHVMRSLLATPAPLDLAERIATVSGARVSVIALLAHLGGVAPAAVAANRPQRSAAILASGRIGAAGAVARRQRVHDRERVRHHSVIALLALVNEAVPASSLASRAQRERDVREVQAGMRGARAVIHVLDVAQVCAAVPRIEIAVVALLAENLQPVAAQGPALRGRCQRPA